MPEEKRADLLDRVKNETKRIHRIIQNLLTYARPDHEAAQSADPSKILRAAQGLLESQKRFQKVSIIHQPGEHTTAWPKALVSPTRLQQVLVNLLLNAADAMDGDGTITVSCETSDEHVRIVITDTGPGIPPGQQRKIFDPFFSTKEPGHGTGLGLSISRSIVESYGGTLNLDAGHKPGASFVITLPRGDAA
jgi:signal transduction histidine kinase